MRYLVTLLAVAAVVIASLTPFAAGRKDEPDVVVVQHLLIGFKKSVRGKKLDRTKVQARELAESLLERAQAGEDFDALVKEYTNDKYPGIFKLTNRDAPLMAESYPRKSMVTAFGDVAFNLKIGEVGMTKHHAGNSPFGYHVIKRLE